MLAGDRYASLEVDSLRSMYFDMKNKQASEAKKDLTVRARLKHLGRYPMSAANGN